MQYKMCARFLSLGAVARARLFIALCADLYRRKEKWDTKINYNNWKWIVIKINKRWQFFNWIVQVGMFLKIFLKRLFLKNNISRIFEKFLENFFEYVFCRQFWTMFQIFKKCLFFERILNSQEYFTGNSEVPEFQGWVLKEFSFSYISDR